MYRTFSHPVMRGLVMDVNKVLMDRVKRLGIDTAVDNEVAKAIDPSRDISSPVYSYPSHIWGVALVFYHPVIPYDRKIKFREKRAIKKSGCNMEEFSKLVAWYAERAYPEYSISVEDGSYIGDGHWGWVILIPA